MSYDYAMAEGLAHDVLAQAMQGQQNSLWTDMQAFVHAIDWTEPLLIAILSFHAVLTIAVLIGRHFFWLQTCLFVFLLGAVYAAEALNAIAAEHWQTIATQNYFDKQGLFTGIVFCAPLLALALIQVVIMLVQASILLVKVKRAELMQKAKTS